MIWHIYAFIYNGVVQDTYHSKLGVDLAIMRAKAIYGDEASAVDCTLCNVQKGDTYQNGKFYHDGVEVEAIPDVYNYDTYISQLNNDIDDLIISLTPEVPTNV